MCLTCGCGNATSQNGDPLNITLSRLRLIAIRNNMTMDQVACNILATVRGLIDRNHPLGLDVIKAKVTREPGTTVARYVEVPEEERPFTAPTKRAKETREERKKEREEG